MSEGVQPIKGELIPASREELFGNWTRDKILISRVCHVMLLDGADEGSVGLANQNAGPVSSEVDRQSSIRLEVTTCTRELT
jgi:hypothetical protein